MVSGLGPTMRRLALIAGWGTKIQHYFVVLTKMGEKNFKRFPKAHGRMFNITNQEKYQIKPRSEVPTLTEVRMVIIRKSTNKC